MIQKSFNDTPSLYLIPTPIGNLDDITVRSLNTLKTVDVILCEDTRDTGLLLSHYDIKKKLVSCHEYNEDKIIDNVVSMLKDGLNIGLVTDQGTPIISDPGYIVSRGVIEAGFNVISLPGATAFVPALITSGISPQPFLFYGFLNSNDSKKKKELEELSDNKCTMIFYEAPHRIMKTLNLMLEIFGDRNVSISREITKKFESIYRGKISEVMKMVPEKGEFVLIVEGSSNSDIDESLSIVDAVNIYIKAGFSVMDSIKKVAKERNVPKNEIYNVYHKGE